MPKTPIRALRVEDSLWRAAQLKARAEGVTVSGKIRAWLREWTGEK